MHTNEFTPGVIDGRAFLLVVGLEPLPVPQETSKGAYLLPLPRATASGGVLNSAQRALPKDGRGQFT
jgi:hypothetical protein